MENAILEYLSDQGCGIFPIHSITYDKTLYELGIDSLRYMDLIVWLEETFQMTVPDEMLDISAEITVKTVIGFVANGRTEV
ncbi:phosphopantetheine-binding protein [Cohnella soli]|uniref:Phosphopantetheine-binding protein n=1 Tax=Cohnella soli TaxID=425005 RepID=A0ABW0I1D7_9BACL